MEQFVTELRTLVKDCSYANLEEMIRDRIVFGISYAKVREKLINEGEKLTLDRAITILRVFKAAIEDHVGASNIINVPKCNNGPKCNTDWVLNVIKVLNAIRIGS